MINNNVPWMSVLCGPSKNIFQTNDQLLEREKTIGNDILLVVHDNVFRTSSLRANSCPYLKELKIRLLLLLEAKVYRGIFLENLNKGAEEDTLLNVAIDCLFNRKYQLFAGQ